MADHIVLTSHPRGSPHSVYRPVHWGAATSAERGPLIGNPLQPAQRNVIGSHSGAYSIYRALAVASGQLQRDHRPDLTNTAPVKAIGPHPQWADPHKIVSLDPWGHRVAEAFAAEIAAGAHVRVTKVAIDPVWFLSGRAERFKITERALRRCAAMGSVF